MKKAFALLVKDGKKYNVNIAVENMTKTKKMTIDNIMKTFNEEVVYSSQFTAKQKENRSELDKQLDYYHEEE